MTKTKGAKAKAKHRAAMEELRHKAGCNCLSHIGKQKIAYTSQKAALEGAIRLMRYGTTIYPCPTTENRWHVATTKRRKFRGK